MADNRFYQNKGPLTLKAISEAIGVKLKPEYGDILINDVNSLSSACQEDICFLNNKKYTQELENTKAKAAIVPMDFADYNNQHNTIMLPCSNPYYAYSLVLDLLYCSKYQKHNYIHSSALISKSAKIGKNCYIGPNVVINDECEIGDNSYIEAGCFIGMGTKIGNNAKIYANVVITHTIIGDDAVILAGASIGQDGFGFATEKGVHKKIYHIGRVIIGNNVEIGAGTTIDRGSLNDTIIEDLCRIDNLVQIGHNVKIKRGSIVVAQAGIAGSSEIGSYCALGGQVGVSGHIKITDQVQIAGQGGVIQNIDKSGIYGGCPATPIRDWHKSTIIMKNLVNKKH